MLRLPLQFAVLGRAGGGGEGEGKGEVGGTRGLEGLRLFGRGSAERAQAIVQVILVLCCALRAVYEGLPHLLASCG